MQQCQLAFGIAMQKAVIPGASEAFRQDMDQQQPDQVFPFQGPGCAIWGLAVLVPEGDLCAVVLDQWMVTEYAMIQLT